MSAAPPGPPSVDAPPAAGSTTGGSVDDRSTGAAGSPGDDGSPGGGSSGGGSPAPVPPSGTVTPGDTVRGEFGPRVATVLAVLVVLVLAAAAVLRFWTRSDLWLDEALTVNIASQPLHRLPFLLKRDGAPPLYYALLHLWMGVFGTSDVAVRALSGVFGLATLPLAWLATKRVGGRLAAWIVLLLVASSPFAVRYDTETRMYALVTFLTVCGLLALERSLRTPRAGNLVAVGVVTALLLYSHYWANYLVGVVALWLAFQWWRGPAWRRRGARASLVAVAVGCLAFLPWLPTFLYQSQHTGTPWALPANFSAVVNAVSTFAGGVSSPGRALGLLFFAAAGIGLCGLAVDRFTIDVDLRTRPPGRPFAWVFVGTMSAAIVGGYLSHSAFDARYASVVFIPLVILVALGFTVVGDKWVRVGLVAVAVVLGLAGSASNVTTNRTQAGQVAAAVAGHGAPGDVVVYCPDQLGPSVNRLLPAGRYRQTTYPRGTGPAFVNWVDYGSAISAVPPAGFAQRVLASAGTHRIFVVWAGGYQEFGLRCEQIVETIQADPRYRATGLVTLNSVSFYQPMNVTMFTPVGA